MKIYIYCVPSGIGSDVIGYALAEDGTGLAQHLSSNPSWSKRDLGMTGNWKHEFYREHCPDGYELEWVDDPVQHAGLQAALAKNQREP